MAVRPFYVIQEISMNLYTQFPQENVSKVVKECNKSCSKQEGIISIFRIEFQWSYTIVSAVLNKNKISTVD